MSCGSASRAVLCTLYISFPTQSKMEIVSGEAATDMYAEVTNEPRHKLKEPRHKPQKPAPGEELYDPVKNGAGSDL